LLNPENPQALTIPDPPYTVALGGFLRERAGAGKSTYEEFCEFLTGF
jgi:hypothetical protein